MISQVSLAKVRPGRVRMTLPVKTQEKRLLALADSKHWPFRVLGIAPVPETPLYAKDWWLVPIAEDHSQIPARALERVRAIYEAGIRPKAFVIAHEAPKQIAPLREAPLISPVEYWTKRVGEQSVTVLKTIGTVVAVAAPIVLTVLGAGLLASLAIAGAVVTDPCLIAVTEDDVWIQVDYWMA